MNAESMMVDPNELVIDMPLDEANVKIKMESLAANGVIQEVTVWLQGMRIIDGFHRTEAARRLGWTAIPCRVIDCSEDAFWDARIQSAKQHHAVAKARLDTWIMESWRLTEWYVPDDERGEKWSLYKEVWNELFSFDKNDGVIRTSIFLNPSSLAIWLSDKAARWGISEYDLARSILSGINSRALDAMTNEGLTFDQVMRASEGLRHENPYGYASRLGVQSWLDAEIKTNKAQPKAFYDFDRERKTEKAKVQEQFWQTPQGKAQLEKRQAEARLDKVRESISNARAAISAMSIVILDVPDASAMLAEFAQFVADFAAEHFPGIEVAQPNPVSLDNARLRSENAKLRERIASLERALGSKQAAGEMLSSAIAWSSGDLDR